MTRRLSLARLSWANLWSKPWVAGLNLLLLALGFGAITFVLLVSEQAEQQLQRDLAGIDLVVGAKGSPMQLILSGVFHLDAPTGNIPASAQEALRAHPLVAQVIPMALGDSARGFRIVGTSPDYLALYGAQLAQGRWGSASMQAVIGAEVARTQGWYVGQRFTGSHGLGEGGAAHTQAPFTVTGVLAPTGSVLDRLVLTPVSSVWVVHEAHHGQAHDEHDAHEDDSRELTLLLVRYRSPLAAVSLPRWVNSQDALQSASPALEAARLFRMVGIGVDVLKGFAAVMLLVASLSVFIALSHAVRERQADLAMMRMLGASPTRVSLTVALEALALALLGALLGLALGHAITQALGWALHSSQPSLRLTGLWLSPSEAWVPLLALGLSTLACLGPTWRAYRTHMLPLLQGR